MNAKNSTAAKNSPKIAPAIDENAETFSPAIQEKEENFSSAVIVPNPKKPLTIEEKLKVLEMMVELSDRRDILYTSISNLKSYFVSPDVAPCSIKLQDSKGKSFNISHPVIIGEIVTLCLTKLTAEMLDIESKITFTF